LFQELSRAIRFSMEQYNGNIVILSNLIKSNSIPFWNRQPLLAAEINTDKKNTLNEKWGPWRATNSRKKR